MAILAGMRCYLIVVLICISLSDVEHILCAFWPSVCLLRRNAYLGLLPIFWLSCLFLLLLSCMSNFYILDTKPFLVDCIVCKYFLPLHRLYFCFFYGFLYCARDFCLIRSHLFIFVFISIAWETDLRKQWYDLCQRIFCLWPLLGVLWCLVFYLSL